MCFTKRILKPGHSVADPDPVLFWPPDLDPGPRIGYFRVPHLGSQPHIFESLVGKSSISLLNLAQNFFFSISKIKLFSILWNLWLQKRHYKFYLLFWSGNRDPGSGMDKNQVQDKHLGSATLQKNVKKLSKISLWIPGSGKNLFRIPGSKGTGSATVLKYW
jgi:hypothetical protein